MNDLLNQKIEEIVGLTPKKDNKTLKQLGLINCSQKFK